MNILQVIPELNVGGVETGTVDFAKYLVLHGHKAVIVSHGGQLVEGLKDIGAIHHRLAVHKKSLWTAIKMVKSLRAVIESEKIDIVHARSRVPAWIAYFACRKTKAAFITTCHGYYKNRFFSQVMGWSKLVIVPSKVIGRHMVDDFKVLSRHIRCIPRSVDLERFQINEKTSQSKTNCTITIVGRLTSLKGHTFFLRAMAKVIRSIPHARIWIVGDAPPQKGAYKKDLEVLVRRLGMESHVEFLGSRQDVPAILSRSNILVLSTVTQEAFGRVILEAQASGVPVVATNVGGVIDIIDDGKTGLLVPPKDIDAMAKAVIRLYKDKALVQRIVIEAQKKLKNHFTLEHMASSTVRVYEELLNSLNILVIKLASIGDVVLVTSSLKALRKKFPHARIHCLIGRESRKILHNCPYLDGIIVYDRKGKERGWLRLIKFSRKLRKHRFDIIVDFQNSRKSHLLSYLSFPKGSYGYHRQWGSLLTNPIEDVHSNMPPVAHQFQVLKELGISYNSNSYLELWPSSKDKQYAKNLLDSEWLGNKSNMIGINIAASLKWQTKNWPIEYIARICDMLSASNVRVIITGLDKDLPLARHLLSIAKSKPANFVGKTDILQLAALIKECKVFLTSDSAPLHVAAAMQVPVVVLFGPTDSRRHIPPAKRIVILEKKLACAPCYGSRCRILTHACMKDIQPEEVYHEIERLMEGKK